MCVAQKVSLTGSCGLQTYGTQRRRETSGDDINPFRRHVARQATQHRHRLQGGLVDVAQNIIVHNDRIDAKQGPGRVGSRSLRSLGVTVAPMDSIELMHLRVGGGDVAQPWFALDRSNHRIRKDPRKGVGLCRWLGHGLGGGSREQGSQRSKPRSHAPFIAAVFVPPKQIQIQISTARHQSYPSHLRTKTSDRARAGTGFLWRCGGVGSWEPALTQPVVDCQSGAEYVFSAGHNRQEAMNARMNMSHCCQLEDRVQDAFPIFGDPAS